MDREDIIRMAQESGVLAGYEGEPSFLERFAALVAAAEREACAKVEPTCKQDLQVWVTDSGQFSWEPQDERYWTKCVPASALAAEQDRILRIVYEQLTPYGKTGECAWIGVKHKVRQA